MQKKKQQRPLNPEAAKILEQYRNAGKAAPDAGGAALDADGVPIPPPAPPPSRPSAPPPSPMRRSGTRGK